MKYFQLIQDQINQWMNSSEVKHIDVDDEQALQRLTHRIIDSLKWLVSRYVKQNYKIILQVFLSKIEQKNLYLINRCLWNHQTDDLFSIELENDRLRILIIIYGFQFISDSLEC